MITAIKLFPKTVIGRILAPGKTFLVLELTYTLETIDHAVKRFWEELQGYQIFAFDGEMGAGKTTFIHKLCDYLQVADVVSSPTFALINEYHFAGNGSADNIIYHMDWYRLKDTDEAINAGMEDCIDETKGGEAFCFIEWPEKARDLLRPPYVWINIETITATERKMTVKVVPGHQ